MSTYANSDKPSRIGRPVRRARRWLRHTPNATLAVAMISLGVALIFLGVLLAIFLL
jgi:hypothetical protein